MPTIWTSDAGTINGVWQRGEINPLGERLAEITRPGVDGVAYRRDGKRAEPFEILTLADAATAEDAGELIKTYKALEGTLQNWRDTTDLIWYNIAILEVRPLRRRRIVCSVGGIEVADGDGGYIVEARWLCQATEVPE